MFVLMSVLVIAALAVLFLAAVVRKRDYARFVPMVVGLCLAVAAIELAYRQGLSDGAGLTFYRPVLHAQQSQLLLYAAVMVGAAVVAIALAAVFRANADAPAEAAPAGGE